MLNTVVIGATGGIGQEFVKQLSQNDQVKTVFALSRNEVKFTKQNGFKSEKIKTCCVDIENEESIQLAVKKIIQSKNISPTIDRLIVATGILHNHQIRPEKSLNALSAEKFQKLFAINTIAPALIAKYFLPQMSKNNKSVFAVLSARVSSISDNYLGGWYAYRSSKSALNMIVKTASIELQRFNKNAIIIGLHPGTVDTSLSKPFQTNINTKQLFTAKYAVKKLWQVIEKVEVKDSGFLFDFNNLKIEF